MRRTLAAAALAALAATAAAPGAHAAPGRFELVGSDPLLNRGMNAGLAVHGNHAYVGSRTDGTHPNAGVLVVDVSQPSRPRVVGQIGPPEEGNPGESSRELRVWPERDLLIVMNFECDPVGHACAGASGRSVEPTFRFYDIAGESAARPRLVSTYRPSRVPHEFFLWDDPERDGRALLYISAPGDDGDEAGGAELIVTDVSRAREGEFRELGTWEAEFPGGEPEESGLHSLSVSDDGRRAYLAYLAGGFFMADTSDFAEGAASPRVRPVTPAERSVHRAVPGVHSAVELEGRPFALITDEVYGAAFGLGPFLGFSVLQGCPWGWTRLVDVSDPALPRVAGEYRVRPFNDPDFCDEATPAQENGASFSSHNPTLTRHLALITWHSAGLQAVSLADPARPSQAAEFLPEPLPAVATEDPALSTGTEKVVMWSYPIVKDGLVYVVDLRNGLFVLRYRGPFAGEVSCARFLEGNSNLGDARRPCGLEISGRTVRLTRSGFARVRVSCRLQAPASCGGSLKLKTAGRVRSGRFPGKRARRVKLGVRAFQLPAGRTGVVKVRLSRKNRRLLGRLRRARVAATAVVAAGEGESVTSDAAFWLRTPRRASR